VKGCLTRRTAFCFAVVLMPIATQPAAQDKPDFSGSWVLESAAQSALDAPQGLSVSQSLVGTNVRGEAMKPFFKEITVTRALEGGPRSETYQIGVVGGTVSGLADGAGNGTRTHHRVQGEDEALIIERGS